MDNRIYFEKFLSEDDFRYYSSLVLNEKVMVMNYGRAFLLDEAKYIYEWELKRNKKYEGFGSFKVFQRDSNKFIGYGALLPKDDLTEVEIEYMLLPEYWEKGYGSEIVRKLLKMVEETESIQQVTANIAPNNIGSKKILLNNGFVSCKLYKNPDDGSPVEMFSKKLQTNESLY